MRGKMKLAFGSVVLLALAAMGVSRPDQQRARWGAALRTKATAEQPEADDGLDVYFRDTDLDATSPQALVQYFDDRAG